MAKTRTQFLCSACGSVHPKWMGKCPDCGTWDTLERFTEVRGAAAGAPGGFNWLGGAGAEGTPADAPGVPVAGGFDPVSAPGPLAEPMRAPQALPLEAVPVEAVPRVPSGIGELDRVLGGGFVPGSVVLVGGEPGIGKSTLLLQAAARLASASAERHVLYVSSEESAQQVRMRADRVLAEDGDAASDEAASGIERARRNLYLLPETNLARIVEQARRVRPTVCVIDSIQMIFRGDIDAVPGSITQLRRCCMELVHLAKVSGMAIVVVGHVTKEGQFAGPKLLEHLVDVAISFEGDRDHARRVVRAVKNRYGSTLEIGLFEMTGAGLEEVEAGVVSADPSAPAKPGTAVCPSLHGSRCLLAEVQALTATGILGAARRKASGLDSTRLAMLIAVLEKHGGLRLSDQDVYAAVAGGLRVIEPAVDLAVALAVAGAHLRRVLPPAMAVVGEVGLSGDIRPLRQLDHRAAEAARHGFTVLLCPDGAGLRGNHGIQLEKVRTLAEALEWFVEGMVPGPRAERKSLQRKD